MFPRSFSNIGIKWYEKAFDKFGNYTQFDPNLPEFLPKRADVIKYYAHDSPITNRGYCSALKAGIFGFLKFFGILGHCFC